MSIQVELYIVESRTTSLLSKAIPWMFQVIIIDWLIQSLRWSMVEQHHAVGCFLAAGTDRLVSIKGGMNNCSQIVRDPWSLFQDVHKFRPCWRFTFQHNNKPKQTAKNTLQRLQDKAQNMLMKSSQRPDVNHTEHLWRESKMEVHNSTFTLRWRRSDRNNGSFSSLLNKGSEYFNKRSVIEF